MREDHRQVEKAVTTVQAHIRGFLARVHTRGAIEEARASPPKAIKPSASWAYGEGLGARIGSSYRRVTGRKERGSKERSSSPAGGRGKGGNGSEANGGGAHAAGPGLSADHEARLAALEQTMQRCCALAEALLEDADVPESDTRI